MSSRVSSCGEEDSLIKDVQVKGVDSRAMLDWLPVMSDVEICGNVESVYQIWAARFYHSIGCVYIKKRRSPIAS